MNNSKDKNRLAKKLPQNEGSQNITSASVDYKFIFKYSIDAFIIISTDFSKIIEINDATLKLFGYKKKEFLNLKGRDLISDDEQKRLRYFYNKNSKNFDGLTFDLDVKTKTNKKIPISVSVKKISSCEQEQYLLIARDISNVKQTEEALKREAFIFENLHDAVIIIDLESYIQSWNKAAELLFGYTKQEVTDQLIKILFREFEFDESFNEIKQTIKKNLSWNGETNIIRKNGEEGITETSIFPFRDSAGEHIAYVVIAKDITLRKQAEQEMREMDLMYRSLIESSADAIYVLKGRRLLLVNSAWCKMFGYTRKEVISDRFDIMNIVAPESKEMILKRFATNINHKGEYSNYELKGITKDNRTIDLDVRANKILWKGEEVYQGIYRDITERKKAENELKESEEKFRKLAEKSLVGIYIIQDGLFQYVNPKLAEIFDYTVEELIGKKGPYDLTAERDREMVRDYISSRVSGKVESISYTFIGLKKDQEEIYIEALGSRTTFLGKPAVIGTLMDITERMKNEAALKESEKKYRSIIEAANDAIIIVDIETRNIIDINKKVEKLTNHSREGLIGKSHLFLHPKELREEYSNVFTDVIKQNQQISPGVVLLQDKDGAVIPVEISNSKYTLEGREVIQGIFRDMRERINIEDQIRKLSRAVEQSPSAIVITNIDGTIEYVNPYFCSVAGYSAEEVIGQNPRILKSGETSSDDYSEMWKTISSGKDWHGEFHNKKKNGELYWEQASISPVRDEKGKITHYIAIKEDITYKKQMQQELLLAKEKAEESDRMKSEFLSQMSHEIRTPLNVILSYNSFLKDEFSETLNEDIKLSFNSIDSAGKRLLRTIDMILNLAAIQKGTLDIDFDQVEIGNIINSLVKEFKFHAREKNLYLNINVPDEKIYIPGDEYLISEIFQNLLNNAIKYTNKGGVDVELSVLNDEKVRIDIKDTGIGISQEYLPKLFIPFSQEETGYTRKFEGNGLGLALVKSYLDLLKAEIKVESEKGRGTTFSILFDSTNHAS